MEEPLTFGHEVIGRIIYDDSLKVVDCVDYIEKKHMEVEDGTEETKGEVDGC